MYGHVRNCYFEGMRHCVMTGGIEGVVRYIQVSGCQMNGCRAAGIDTHPTADMVSFTNNVISAAIGDNSTSSQNGIQHYGGTFNISGNIIRGAGDQGTSVQARAKNRPVSGVIANNVIEHSEAPTGLAAIYVECSNTSSRLESLAITGNVVRDGWARGLLVLIIRATSITWLSAAMRSAR